MVQERSIGAKTAFNAQYGSGSATNGNVAKLWHLAKSLRGASETEGHEHVVLGLVFLKLASDAFEERRAVLTKKQGQGCKADPDDPGEYREKGLLWFPSEARWSHIIRHVSQRDVGQLIVDAMASIERHNPLLRDVLPKAYGRHDLGDETLGQIIDTVSDVNEDKAAVSQKYARGAIFETILSQFPNFEGNKRDDFRTPRCVAKLLVTMLQPHRGLVYDPCCGSAQMFAQVDEFIRANTASNDDCSDLLVDTEYNISYFGQEKSLASWQLAKMNMAVRGIHVNVAHGDSFLKDHHQELKADYIFADPPFSTLDWGKDSLSEDERWEFGVPPRHKASFAWLQHVAHHLSPDGVAGVVLANNSMAAGKPVEDKIRKGLIEADLVDCMVALPGQLFNSTLIPVCLWILAKNRRDGEHRDRRGEILFVDGRKLGFKAKPTRRELADEDIAKISNAYAAWRRKEQAGDYADVPGFCRAVPLDEIRGNEHILSPGLHVGLEVQAEDAEPAEVKLKRLAAQLRKQQEKATELDNVISTNLKGIGLLD